MSKIQILAILVITFNLVTSDKLSTYAIFALIVLAGYETFVLFIKFLAEIVKGDNQ